VISLAIVAALTFVPKEAPSPPDIVYINKVEELPTFEVVSYEARWTSLRVLREEKFLDLWLVKPCVGSVTMMYEYDVEVKLGARAMPPPELIDGIVVADPGKIEIEVLSDKCHNYRFVSLAPSNVLIRNTVTLSNLFEAFGSDYDAIREVAATPERIELARRSFMEQYENFYTAIGHEVRWISEA